MRVHHKNTTHINDDDCIGDRGYGGGDRGGVHHNYTTHTNDDAFLELWIVALIKILSCGGN